MGVHDIGKMRFPGVLEEVDEVADVGEDLVFGDPSRGSGRYVHDVVGVAGACSSWDLWISAARVDDHPVAEGRQRGRESRHVEVLTAGVQRT